MPRLQHERDTDPRRTLVHHAKAADSVPRPVPKVHAVLPQVVPDDPVESRPARPGGEDQRIDGDVSLQNARERALVLFGCNGGCQPTGIIPGRLRTWCPEMHGPRRVDGAVEVLLARVTLESQLG